MVQRGENAYKQQNQSKQKASRETERNGITEQEQSKQSWRLPGVNFWKWELFKFWERDEQAGKRGKEKNLATQTQSVSFFVSLSLSVGFSGFLDCCWSYESTSETGIWGIYILMGDWKFEASLWIVISNFFMIFRAINVSNWNSWPHLNQTSLFHISLFLGL